MNDTGKLEHYRKKPVTVAMIRWDGTDEALRVIRWHELAPSAVVADPRDDGSLDIWVHKSRAIMNLRRGDWAAVERDGSGVYPITAEDHEDSYEPAGGNGRVTVSQEDLAAVLDAAYLRYAPEARDAYVRVCAAAGVRATEVGE